MIKNSLPKALSYDAFKNLMDSLLLQGKTTGDDQPNLWFSLTKLNRQRIKRIDNTLEFSVRRPFALQANFKRSIMAGNL